MPCAGLSIHFSRIMLALFLCMWRRALFCLFCLFLHLHSIWAHTWVANFAQLHTQFAYAQPTKYWGHMKMRNIICLQKHAWMIWSRCHDYGTFVGCDTNLGPNHMQHKRQKAHHLTPSIIMKGPLLMLHWNNSFLHMLSWDQLQHTLLHIGHRSNITRTNKASCRLWVLAASLLTRSYFYEQNESVLDRLACAYFLQGVIPRGETRLVFDPDFQWRWKLAFGSKNGCPRGGSWPQTRGKKCISVYYSTTFGLEINTGDGLGTEE